ncbi:hypothetical protein V3H18_07635 [Methylocystis sp. 9N]|uniref:Uncharacterized protein n=1 Tax=Methylocystis borbori TaxID=3118750 RepID=A0ABU7XG86_9HYPH
MTRFVVDLGDLKISDELKGSIAADIQGAVLTRLGAQPSLGKRVVYLPREWMGFVLREKFEDLAAPIEKIGALVKERI